jgi:hypothetical protein
VPLENLEMSEPARSLGLSEMAACVPSRMISLYWIATLVKKKASAHPALTFDAPLRLVAPNDDHCPCSCGHPWNTFGTGRVTGVLRPVDFQYSACLVPTGRHTPIGIRTEGERPDFFLMYEKTV